jgi:uncharacterized membrane protein
MTHNEQENTTIWALIFVACSVIAFALTAVAIDTRGRQDRNHREALPANVAQLSPSAYLIGPRARVAPPQICRGSDSNGTAIKTTRDVAALEHALYIECTNGQTWSDDRPRSVNFAHAMSRALVSPAWWLAEAIMLVVCGLYTAYVLAGMLFERNRARRARKAERKRKAVTAEDKRRELAAAYAAGDISDIQFEQGLDRLYDLAPRRKA